MSKAEKKKWSGIVVVLLASVLSLGAGVGAMTLYTKNFVSTGVDTGEPLSAKPAPVASAAPVFLDLDPFTLTLNNATQSRVLYMGLTVRLQDEASRDRIKTYMPVVRSRILTELSEIDPGMVSERGTKEAIRRVLTDSLSRPFTESDSAQHVSDVLFTAYVVQ